MPTQSTIATPGTVHPPATIRVNQIATSATPTIESMCPTGSCNESTARTSRDQPTIGNTNRLACRSGG